MWLGRKISRNIRSGNQQLVVDRDFSWIHYLLNRVCWCFILILSFLGGTVQSVFTCDRCDKSYKHSSSLWKHRKYVCGKAPTFCCQSQGCNYKAKRKDHLKMHYINLHCIPEQIKRSQDVHRTETIVSFNDINDMENSSDLLIVSEEVTFLE